MKHLTKPNAPDAHLGRKWRDGPFYFTERTEWVGEKGKAFNLVNCANEIFTGQFKRFRHFFPEIS